MFNVKQLFQHALLALALAFGSGAAVAGPTYQVTIDTSSLAGSDALFDLSFLSVDGAVGATASLWNFSGAFGTEAERAGSVAGDIGSGLTLTNADGFNYLTQAITLGGNFSFMISFGGDYESIGGPDGASFAVTIYDQLFNVLAQPMVFDLVPAFLGANAYLDVHIDTSIASATAVPEPSHLLLVLTALAMLGLAMRRRSR